MLNTNLILVTGASGWLGTRLVRSLHDGLNDYPDFQSPDKKVEIRCFIKKQDVFRFADKSNRISVIYGDLRDNRSLEYFFEGAEGAILFHTAGIIHPQRSREFDDINLTGTKNLLTLAANAKIKRAVVVSSNSPCGCNPHLDHLFDESSPYNPYLGYGRSKMLMEQFVNGMYSQGKLESVIIRSPWFYGLDQPPRQTLFFKMIRDGKVPLIGGGHNLRSMAYLDNICYGLLLAAKNDQATGQTYWIADEKPYAMHKIIDTIERLLEEEFGQMCAHKRLKLPDIISKVAYGLDYSIQQIGLYNQKIHVLSELNKSIACSIKKAQDELGYHPKIALEEGMKRSLQWCKEKGYL